MKLSRRPLGNLDSVYVNEMHRFSPDKMGCMSQVLDRQFILIRSKIILAERPATLRTIYSIVFVAFSLYRMPMLGVL